MHTSTTRMTAGSLLAFMGLASAGCVRTSSMAYPKDWSPATAIEKTQCPQIAGRYANAGEIANGANPVRFKTGSRYRYRAEWRSDTALSHNIAEGGSGDWVELRQPDADTLIVVSSDPTVDVKELHRSHGDFSCSTRGLERRLHAGLTSVGDNADHNSAVLAGFNGLEMAYAAALGTAGMRTLTRTFNPAVDGSLVMTVSQSETGLVLLIPYHEKSETFVRWERSDLSPIDAANPSPAASAVSRHGDIPSAHVGLFDSMNGFLHHVKVSNLDGNATNTSPTEDARPVALTPGRHWLEIDQIDHRFKPLRDFNTVVGFEMQAAAGHRYRLDKRPPACLAPGDVDLALASHRVYRTRVAIVDVTTGVPARRFEVDALCISGWTLACDASDAFAVKPADFQTCVTLSGSSRGLYGSNAGVALSP
jgi:hypothetical protein